MTVINTNYTTIEEAWGAPISVQKRRRAPRGLPPADPLCDLYNKRGEKVKRPYSVDSNSDPGMALAPYNRAHVGRTQPSASSGYDSIQMHSSNAGRDNHAASYRPIVANTSEDIHHSHHYQFDDDAYFDRALSEDIPGRQGSRLIAYDEPDHHDSLPNHLEHMTPDIPVPVSAPASATGPVTTTQIAVGAAPTSSNEKLLDFGLYIISGVLMIFTMEQILQLGMRMKS